MTPGPAGSGLLASASRDMTARIWQVEQVEQGEQRLMLRAHFNGADSVSFSPDGHLLATGGRDHLVKIWDVRTAQLVKSIEAHERPVLSVAFSPDGRWLASGSGDNVVRLWGIAS